eukprot:gnl/MRDRNA2_/MRDRNA2_35739_c0_seq1.p1 gnl/MRDRNA2_/MRDRNA2_35739_c0~~gnl/MRDRNA2_/MRDRNA2_35739_c0_seq1.p1  ORF type:complete len:360 (+),score=24.63 gnl/MRDRNA2_/MRDRNA2_35739_c0_seq1:70-1149(+)
MAMRLSIAVLFQVAFQQARVGFVRAASFRRQPGDDVAPGVLNFTASTEGEDLPGPYDRTCIRNTGRMCEAAMDPDKTVVDYLGQCDPTSHEHCSTGRSFPAGYCVCLPGWCATASGKCVKERSTLVRQAFQIYTQQYGEAEKLYMLKNGKVMLGKPQSPAQAQWRIVVGVDGVMKLFTNAYPYRYLDSYEHCVRFTESVKCRTMVGSSINPPARDTGWKLDHSEVFAPSVEGTFDETLEYVYLRDFASSKNLFIHHYTKEAMLCSPSDSDCPGMYGNLMFTPTIHGHIEIPITDPPLTTAQTVFHWIGTGLIITIAICLCVFNAQLDNKNTHLDDTVMTAPAKLIRGCVTCSLCGGGRR